MSDKTFVYLTSFILFACGSMFIGYTIWGGIIVNQNTETKHQCYGVWGYDVLGIIYGALAAFGCLLSSFVICCAASTLDDVSTIIGSNDNSKSSTKSNITVLILLGLIIWGAIIFDNAPQQCIDLYKENNNDIWRLYKVTFWGSVALCCFGVLFGCIVPCCFCCFFLNKEDNQTTNINADIIHRPIPLRPHSSDSNEISSVAININTSLDTLPLNDV